MRPTRRWTCTAATLALWAGVSASAHAGVSDTPLPTFTDGRPAQVVYTASGVIKNNNLEIAFLCTNVDSAPVDIGLEVFDETGALRNSIAAGSGEFLDVAPGVTVTVGTGATAVLQEDRTLVLNTAGTGANNLRNGSARVVSTSPQVGCVAFALDRLHTIQDPAVCASCQPPSLSTLRLSSAATPTTTTALPPCGSAPQAGCRKPILPGGARLVLKDRTPGDLDTLVWKWSHGAATAKSDFGSPEVSTSYRLCIYDELGGAPHLELSANAPAGGTCGTRPCWAENSAGFKYTNKAATPDGLVKIALRAGGEGSAKIGVKGKGVNLLLPALPLRPP